MYQSMSALLQLGKSSTYGCLGVKCFQPPLDVSGELCVSFSSSKFQTEHVTGQCRHLILLAPCWMEASWFAMDLNMLADIPYWVPIVKDLIMDFLVGQVFKDLQLLHLTLWLGCVLHRKWFCSLVCQVVAGEIEVSMTKSYQQCWKEWSRWYA